MNMIKRLLVAALFLFIGNYTALAQSDTAAQSRFVQYAGVQLNPLIRQVINFNSTTQTTVNPYLLTYSVNERKTGNGIRIGFGININQTTTDDGVTKNQANETDFEIRVGYDKMYRLSKHWELGYGIDLLVNNNNDFTTTTTRSFETDITQVDDLNFNYGLGPMAWIRFYATKRILIGTEASLYYTRGFPKEKISNYSEIPNEPPQYSSTSVTEFNATASVALPVAFYMIIKF